MSKLNVHLLIALRAAGRFGAAEDDLLVDMRRGSHRELSAPDLVQALRDLADQSYVSAFNSALETKRWKITRLGTDALKEEGL